MLERASARRQDGYAVTFFGLGYDEAEWLEASGLTVEDGVVCDATLYARGAADVVAAGDVVRWPHSL